MMTKIQNHYPVLTLILLLVFMAGLMGIGLWTDSATSDELAHIPAGYSHIRYLDYRLNIEHPPLMKALAALPLLFFDVQFPITSNAWTTETNGQWEVGKAFLYTMGNNPYFIIRVSRIIPTLLTLLTTYFIYALSRKFMEARFAILPTLFFGLSPTVLAHGHYVTNDIAATLGIFLAVFFFSSAAQFPNRTHFLLAALSFGVAQLFKFSALLLVPFFVFLTIIFFLLDTSSRFITPALLLKRLLYYVRLLSITFFGGFLIVYAVYFLFTFHYSADTLSAHHEELVRDLPLLSHVVTTFSSSPWFLPISHYLTGAHMSLTRFLSHGSTVQFMNEVSSKGWVSYFPTLFVLKETLSTLIFLAAASLASVVLIGRFIFLHFFRSIRLYRSLTSFLSLRFSEVSFVCFVLFYLFAAMSGTLTIGLRHLLPIYPFIFIIATLSIRALVTLSKHPIPPPTSQCSCTYSHHLHYFRFFSQNFFVGFFFFFIILFHITSVFRAAPYFLSYFNVFGGGTWNGYRIATDSNYDWGQDLLRLKYFLINNPQGMIIPRMALHYFGGSDPTYYLGDRISAWDSEKGDPRDHGFEWFAISATLLQLGTQPLAPGEHRLSGVDYPWLKDITPTFRIGTTLFVYNLSSLMSF